MRIHLRHTRTGQWVQSPNTWTDELEMAYDFKFADRALRFAQTWEITEAQVHFQFEAPALEADEVSTRILRLATEGPFLAEAA